MGLQRKRQQIRLGPAEALMLVLLIALLLTAWPVGSRAYARHGMLRVPAVIDGIAWAGSTTEESPASIRVRYHYVVNGVRYEGIHQDPALQRALFFALPARILAVLKERGMLDMNNIPSPVADVLRKKGVTSLSRIPVSLVAAVWQAGYRSLLDVPRSWVAAARASNYEFLARQLDRILPEAAAVSTSRPPGLEADAGEWTRSWQAQRDASVVEPIVVRVSPQSPHLHALDSSSLLSFPAQLILSLLVAALTILYAVWGYAWLKQRVPEEAPALKVQMG